jgi:hypothetical protein
LDKVLITNDESFKVILDISRNGEESSKKRRYVDHCCREGAGSCNYAVIAVNEWEIIVKT